MATSKHRSLLVREPSVMDWDAVKFPAVPCRPHTFTSMYLTEDFQPKEVYAPDPIRQGAIGGTWRHIKEVLGHHGGSRICFIDGLVSVYDTDKFTQALQPQLPYRGKMVQPPYAPTQQEYADSKKGVHFPPVETDVDRKLRMNSQPIHRGHYKFN